MSLEVTVNISSLRLVEEELGHTLAEASDKFESFLSERHNLDLLEQSSQAMQQVAGTLDLLQVPGAALLAAEIHQLLQYILSDDHADNLSDTTLSDLSSALFVLPKYLEFIAQRQSDVPLLAGSFSNDLRRHRKAAPLNESSFLQEEFPLFSAVSKLGVRREELSDEERAEALKRLRHMFQVGLLGAIRDSGMELNLRLMGRAVQRLTVQINPGPLQRFWLLVNMVLECMQRGGLEVSSTRKRLFTAIDKELRKVITNPAQAAQAIPATLERELIFLLKLSAYREGAVERFLTAAKITAFPMLDNELVDLRKQMLGPGFDTLNSVVNELRQEMNGAKDMLEILMQSGLSEEEELRPLITTLQRVADVLRILSLPTLTTLLEQLAESLESLIAQPSGDPASLYNDIADALLFVESSLDQLDRQKLSQSDLAEISQDRRREITSKNLLVQATDILLSEAESGISMAKRAITSYVDSGFDTTHILNVASTLDGIRGSFAILERQRVAAVLSAATRFINDYMAKGDGAKDGHQKLLETLADALISLEYYINELHTRGVADENILKIAEDSLSALGYAVDA